MGRVWHKVLWNPIRKIKSALIKRFSFLRFVVCSSVNLFAENLFLFFFCCFLFVAVLTECFQYEVIEFTKKLSIVVTFQNHPDPVREVIYRSERDLTGLRVCRQCLVTLVVLFSSMDEREL